MEIANDIVRGVVEVLMKPVKEYLQCMISYKSYVEGMDTKMKELEAARVGVEGKKKRNIESCRENPDEVDPWLTEVKEIMEKVREEDKKKQNEEDNKKQNIERGHEVPAEIDPCLSEVEQMPASSSDAALGCLDLRSRHKLGRKAFKMSKEIESLLGRVPKISETEPQIPLGRIDTTKASTSTPSTDPEYLQSRVQIRDKALKALGPEHKHHMVALWGMGGVGKTTLMEELKEIVEQTNMFKYIARADIGEKPDIVAIQQAIADYLGIKFDEQSKAKHVRADKLRQGFKAKSEEGKNKFLIIVDDVWQEFHMEDIGLSRWPNQGVDFKVLLTSRKKDVCSNMGVEDNSLLNVSLLEEDEARRFFRQFVNESDYLALQEIGDAIVRKCQGLPIAIKTIGKNLKGQRKHVWKARLACLQHNDIDKVVKEIFGISYNNLKDEEARVFLLCGLFPEDFDIPIEELMRYAWGLKIFQSVSSIRDARNMLKTCTDGLIDSNLLIGSDDFECVKMHDMVRAFVLDIFKEGEHASIVNHGRNPGWPEDVTSTSSCKGISITCEGMSEFPSELKFPNLTVLKLMHGNESLRFPRGFYEEMEKLRVISYDRMKYPLLPASPHQCSSNLRVLLIHRCALAFDLSSVGNLSNLEVLSLANSKIRSLPEAIRNLAKLRVLDLTGCADDLHIDNGVFKRLVSLEELYARPYSKLESISFSGDNCNEVADRWKNLSALEFQFSEITAQLKNLSFKNLERFKISVGCSSTEKEYSLQRGYIIKSNPTFENTLKLKIKKGELLGSRIYNLFEKTVVLSLSVDDMKDLEEVAVKSSIGPRSSSFGNLRELVVSKCAELKYLFKLSVAKHLSNLEHLEVTDCHVMKELVHIGDRREETMTFPKLKSLSLRGLPELSGLCQNLKNKSETSCLFMGEVLFPELEKLLIEDVNGLKEIWPSDCLSIKKKVKLKEIQVIGCDNLVNIFPCNPMPLLHNLEQLEVKKCGSIEALFDIHLDCVREIGEEACRLKRIEVCESGKLREVWRIKGGENNSCVPILAFQAVESIRIDECKMFRFLFTPTTTNFQIEALIDLDIQDSGDIGRNNRLQESSQEQELRLGSPPRSQNNQQSLVPYLEELDIANMERMSHVWKCNWNEFFILHKNLSKSPFHYLKTIKVYHCNSIKYLFSPLMARLLSNLKNINITLCDGIEEVVSHRDDGYEEKTTSTHTSTTLFPHLDEISLKGLKNLKCIDGCGGATATTTFLDQDKFCQVDGVSWALCQYPRVIEIHMCHALSSVIPCDAARQMQKLQVLKIHSCDGMKEVFETQRINNSSVTMLKLGNLKVLKIKGCDLLEHIFTSSTLETLGQLEKLSIVNCKAMKVIVMEEKEEEEDEQTTMASSSKVDFPRLKRIVLEDLPELVGFYLETNIEFQWPSLDDLTIDGCPKMKVFTAGGTTAPQLKYVKTRLGSHLPGCWLNSATTTTGQHQHPESTNSTCHAATLEEFNAWSFHNLIELFVDSVSIFSFFLPKIIWKTLNRYDQEFVVPYSTLNRFDQKFVVPSSELLHLQNLEKIHLKHCYNVEEVFEALEGTNSTTSGFHESPTLVNLPSLTHVDLIHLHGLRYIWKSNRWTLFEFPNLTTVSLDRCYSLQHVFTSSMLGSLKQLQELSISHSSQMEEVIVMDANAVVEEKEEEESDGKMNEIVVLPRLKSLLLHGLDRLKGFCLGKFNFAFPSLDTLTIRGCPAIMTFTTGNSSTPKLKEIKTNYGPSYIEEDINSFIKTKQEEISKW